jgi:two-component system, OmpR family, sensor histidine kinase KdpD
MATNVAPRPRGKLRVYLGAAPGVGKTYAMLAEAQRRQARGADVVAALVETHGRRLTTALAEGLETVPRRTISYRGCDFTEMDLDAVLARHPQVALVDELAHTNVPGCRNPKRWQDVDELLDAGIDVVTTLNIQHLESLSDVTRQITGVEQHEKLPDEIARRADQIELVDMTPEALRRRMVHGNVYPPDRIEAALTHYFRPGNLTALRELALLWVADRVQEGLQRYRTEHGIAAPWETRERIVVGIAAEPGDDTVIRRAARIAARTPGSDLLAVHVTRDDGLAADDCQALAAQRELVASLGGSFQQVPGDDVAEALLQFARAQNATQMVLGASSRSRLATLLAGKSTPTRLARRAVHMDVHLVSRNGQARHRPAAGGLLAGFGRHRAQGKRATAEAAALSRLAVSVLSGHGDAPALLEEIREMSGLAAVSLLEWRRNGSGPRWYVMASAGDRPPDSPDAEVCLPVTETCTLAGRGHPLSGPEAQVLACCAVPMVAGLLRRRQDEQDARTAWQAADSRSRSALLAATGQQAREQLAAADNALAVLNSPDAVSSADERMALAAEARRAVARVAGLLEDLREMRRLHAGALDTYLRSVDLDEVLAAALEDLGPGGPDIALRMPEELPEVIADADLLTRILTSLTAEALRRSPAGVPPALAADSRADRVEIRIADRGVAEGEQESLGFRLARDLTEAMGDTLRCTENEDGGRTVIITLPAAAPVNGARQ